MERRDDDDDDVKTNNTHLPAAFSKVVMNGLVYPVPMAVFSKRPDRITMRLTRKKERKRKRKRKRKRGK